MQVKLYIQRTPNPDNSPTGKPSTSNPLTHIKTRSKSRCLMWCICWFKTHSRILHVILANLHCQPVALHRTETIYNGESSAPACCSTPGTYLPAHIHESNILDRSARTLIHKSSTRVSKHAFCIWNDGVYIHKKTVGYENVHIQNSSLFTLVLCTSNHCKYQCFLLWRYKTLKIPAFWAAACQKKRK